MPGTIPHSCAPHEPLSFSCCRKSCDRKSTGMLARVAAINAAQQRRYSRCQRVPQAIPTPQTGSHRHSRCCQNRQPHCSAFSSAAVRGDTATARACSSRSGEDGSTGGRHAARRQGQQQRLCFARACARLVPVERGAGRPAGRSGQGRVGRDLSDGKRSCDSAAVSARTAASAAVSSSKDTTLCTVCAPPRAG